MLKSTILALLLFLFCLPLNAQSVSRYRIDTSEDSIAKLQWNIAKGLYTNKENLGKTLQGPLDNNLWLPDGQFTLSDVQGVISLYNKVTNSLGDGHLKIDNEDYKFSPKIVLQILNRIKLYVLDTYHKGSIEYDYSFKYKNWNVERYTFIEDGHLKTRVNVYGDLYSRVDKPSVYTSINYASLLIDATETDKTIINTGITLGYQQTYGDRCGLIRRLSARIAPKETKEVISEEIDSQLYKLSQTVRRIVEEGRSQENIIDEWLKLLNNMNGAMR